MEMNHRRRSSIFPQYLRRSERKDSIFQSESTKILYPYTIDEKRPGDYQKITNDDQKSTALKFGWINGVYIRTVLNIFGVMLFLRMGWITGNAGILGSIGIVLISTLLTFCTTLSMSAICTNGEIGTGGIYYMISRSLGAEAGSMIGIIFSLANAVLVSLNLVGAAETTVELMKSANITITNNIENDTRIYGIIFLIIVAIIPLIGMDWEAKAMFVLLIILIVAIGNYLIGTFLPQTDVQISSGNLGWKPEIFMLNLYGQYHNTLSEIFAVFFPSVIGIFAGASMSGDLRDPNAAIPKGTFLAILTTSSVYSILILFLGFTVLPHATGNLDDMQNITYPPNFSCIHSDDGCPNGLINDYQTMTLSAAWGPLIYAGIYAATISSALGSYVCAPRIFQALCEDKLFPYIHYFAKGYGKNNDPRRGYVLTFIISLIFIMIGQVNSIAPIISNFFMASFCLVNVTCFHASFVGSPSFRPTFKYYNKWISLITGLICVVIMFYLDWISAIITVIVMCLIYFYISKKGPDVNWGTSTKGHVYNNALFSALRLTHTKDHVKNFRPSILLLTGNPSARIPLVEFANNITLHRSLLMIGHIVDYEIPNNTREKVIESQYEWMSKRKIKGFYLLLEASSLTNGSKIMSQVAGLGLKLSPNIVMMGYKSSWHDCLVEDLLDYYNVIRTTHEMSLGIIILRIQEGLDYADFFGPLRHSIIDMDDLTTNTADNNNITNTNSNGNMNIKLFQIPEKNDDDDDDDDVDNNPHCLDEKISKTTICLERRLSNTIQSIQQSQQQRILAKKNFEKMKNLIPRDAIEAINQFSDKQKPGPIDVWWLTEDGGLTLLIPYLLNVSYKWSDCSMRIFCLSKNADNIESIKQNMMELLKQQRIPFKELTIIPESELNPSEESKSIFRSMIEKFMNKNDSTTTATTTTTRNMAKVTKIDLTKYETMTNKYLDIRDLLTLHSKSSTLVVMTLPLPHRDIVAPLYMAWLETITKDMPPFLFVRGHKNVLSCDN
ncbi:solute carrier family 12 member 2-like [Dermatophagoides pteronyssinus]|uniref:Solute carrier family 12 member 3 n=1 Tax=Dermatophagoides pteronyssinus TaxID=6956 RepID=A0A6P6Y3L9_DERPT|nr:solute carrier family 12 member 2-like [Dermatophagoides pteronyssinus]XP_027199642.1 solute carrier family 12 member 2-like [Dermatophagoides pteronyssinus]